MVISVINMRLLVALWNINDVIVLSNNYICMMHVALV